MLSLVKYLAPQSLLINSEMRGKGYFFLHHDRVKGLIILDKSKAAILLNEENQGCHQRFRRPNLAAFQILFKEFV